MCNKQQQQQQHVQAAATAGPTSAVPGTQLKASAAQYMDNDASHLVEERVGPLRSATTMPLLLSLPLLLSCSRSQLLRLT
jgi:hypothetical protein